MSDDDNRPEVVSNQPQPETQQPEPVTPTDEPNVVVPYKPAETQPPADLNELVDYLQRENTELKSQITDREHFTEAVRDAVHNPPKPKPIDPRNCSTEEYIANRDAIAKQLGIRRYDV